MEKIYILTQYEYCVFSYDGIVESEMHAHQTKDGALHHAEKLKLKVKEYPETDKECTIEAYNLFD